MNTEDMEEPVPCPHCREWVELQETRECLECHDLLCMDCKEPFAKMCKRCEEEG